MTHSQNQAEKYDNPTIVVLTPGVHNSAYYEHSFLADEMGVELIQGTDLELDGGNIIINTTAGTKKLTLFIDELMIILGSTILQHIVFLAHLEFLTRIEKKDLCSLTLLVRA